MGGPKPRRPEAKTGVSLRLSPTFLKAVHEFVLDYNTAHFRPGFSMGLPEVVTDSLALRWAAEAGLPLLRQQLDEYRKKGGA